MLFPLVSRQQPSWNLMYEALHTISEMVVSGSVVVAGCWVTHPQEKTKARVNSVMTALDFTISYCVDGLKNVFILIRALHSK